MVNVKEMHEGGDGGSGGDWAAELGSQRDVSVTAVSPWRSTRFEWNQHMLYTK